MERKKGIPTEYNGIRFRSRLEARWAAFFDGVGWPWQYEPFDLDGYIPDFVLPVGWGGEPHPILVEVKPAIYVGELPRHAPKIVASGWQHDALIVGASLFEQIESGHHILGVIVDAPTGAISVARSFLCEMCHRHSFAAFDHLVVTDDGVRARGPGGSQPCRLCDDTGTVLAGGHFVEDGEQRAMSIEEAWSTAGNATQWRGGRGA